MRNKIIIYIGTLLISLNLVAQTSQYEIALNTLQERGEVYFSFTVEENIVETVNALTRIISIDQVNNNKVVAYANDLEFHKFVDYNLDFEVLTPPSMMYKSILENSNNMRELNTWDYYPNWDEYNSILNGFVSSYPDLCELVTIGMSGQGREIYCVHINNDLSQEQNEPEFLYSSSIHGDELVGYVVTLRLIDYLLSNYGVMPDITDMVNNIDIWINPLANPDGAFAGGNNSVWGATRGNANNIDLNRNFPDPEDGPNPDGNPWQAETVVFMDFAEEHDFVMASNFHGGAEVVNYPWDTWARLAADDDWWQYVSHEYADLAQENGWPGYFSGFNDGITNGYAWYSISGGRQDYMNYFHETREMTLEISNIKLPPESQLNGFWDANYEALLAYMKQVMNGFSGVITNAVNGNPIEAEVYIEDHEIDNSQVHSNLPIGNYNRPVKAGNYDVKFSAFGYYDEYRNITINDDENLIVNVEMIPAGTLIPEFTSTAVIAGNESYIDYFDGSLGNNIVSWNWTFEGGIPDASTDVNPTDIYYGSIGSFDVTLIITDGNGNSETKYMDDYIEIREKVIIQNGDVTNCDALFYDTGAENNNYLNDEDYTITLYPEVQGMRVALNFLHFDIENHFYCENDYIEIYDGVDNSSPIIGKWCGTNSPGLVYATNDEGALTVYFHSNSTVTKPGWKAEIICDSNVGITQISGLQVLIYPIPASSSITISSEKPIGNIEIYNSLGNLVINEIGSSTEHVIELGDTKSGIYFIKYEIEGKYFGKTIIVDN